MEGWIGGVGGWDVFLIDSAHGGVSVGMCGHVRAVRWMDGQKTDGYRDSDSWSYSCCFLRARVMGS